jgi:hypothetical protein
LASELATLKAASKARVSPRRFATVERVIARLAKPEWRAGATRSDSCWGIAADSGQILYAHIDADYRERAEPAEVLSRLEVLRP